MTKIVVTVSKTAQNLPDGITFAKTAIVVTDNAGNTLAPQTVDGSESPPWTATFTGTVGPNEAQAVITDLDTNGNTIGTPVTLTETGTGGQPQQFQASTGGTISVT